MDVGRRAGLVGAGFLGLGLIVSGCAAGQDAAVPLVDPPASGARLADMGPCDATHARSVCVYGVNDTQVFTAPGQLAPAQLDVSAWNIVNGHDPGTNARTKYLGQYWQAHWTNTVNWLGMAWGNSSVGGPEGTVYYNAPAQLNSESVALYYKDPESDVDNSVGCTGVMQYVSCQALKFDGQDSDNWNAQFTVGNSPVTVAIENGLPNKDGTDTVYASLAPGYSGFLRDPVGDSPNSTGDYRIAVGETRYFGVYRTVSNSSKPDSVFTISYKATDPGSSIPDGVITLNLVLDNSTGALASGGTCTFQGTGATTAYCNTNVAGGSGGPQLVTVTFAEND